MRNKYLMLGVVLGVGFGLAVSLVLDPRLQVNAGERSPCCNGDTNGDGNMDISDAVYLLNHLFTGGPPPAPIRPGDCAHVEGEWNVEVHYRSNTCAMPGPILPVNVSVKQEGCEITVVSGVNEDVRFPGYVCGDLAYWSGRYPYMGSTIHIESLMRLSEENVVQGMTSWTVTSPVGTCDGFETWKAERRRQ